MKNVLLSSFIQADKQNRSLWGAVFGAFLGLLLLLLAIQFYFDIRQLTGKDGQKEDRYVIINKKVGIGNSLKERAAFSDDEVQRISAQPFVRSIGLFSSNKFQVEARSQMLGFYTELFFEALPEQYIDVPKGTLFDWQEGQKQLPIILSRDYLALYNFGYAPSQGLPQVTPATIKRVSMDINLRGNGNRHTLQGQVVGFSDRINSILVPQSFIDWANARFGNRTEKKGVSRIMLEVENPYSTVFTDYLSENEYELSSGKLIGGQLATMLKLLVAVVATLGGVLLLLSVLVFSLFFQLLVSKAAQEIRLLLQIGYYPNQISRVLERRFLTLFGGLCLAALSALLIVRFLQVKWFAAQGFQISMLPAWPVWVVAILFTAGFSYWHIRAIRKNVDERA